jgi:hypothetical protein
MDNWYSNWSKEKHNKVIEDRIKNGRKFIFSNGLPKKPNIVKNGEEALWYHGEDINDTEYAVKATKVNDNIYEISEYIWQGNPVSSTDDAYKKLTQTVSIEDIVSQGVPEEELINNPIVALQWAAKIGINNMDDGSAEQNFVFHIE